MIMKCHNCNTISKRLIFDRGTDKFLCLKCMRLFNPPTMTLIKFNSGSYKKLWNLEIGEYELFDKVEDIAICDWFIRSIQTVHYEHTIATVYHLEYFGDAICGRCVDYKYFDKGAKCLSVACEKMAKPWKHESEIQYPPERSRYSKWASKIRRTKTSLPKNSRSK
jgi:hypothetical protein